MPLITEGKGWNAACLVCKKDTPTANIVKYHDTWEPTLGIQNGYSSTQGKDVGKKKKKHPSNLEGGAYHNTSPTK